MGTEIQVFLQNQDFPVPPIIFTKDRSPYVKIGDRLLILYEFIEGSDSVPAQPQFATKSRVIPILSLKGGIGKKRLSPLIYKV